MALFCLLVPKAVLAAEGLIIGEGPLHGEKLGKLVDILEDRDGRLSIDNVAAASSTGFRRSNDLVPGFGFTTSVYWLRLPVDNRQADKERWVLELAFPPLDDIRLFVPRMEGGFGEKRTGDHFPFRTRDIAYRTYAFDLDQPPGVTTYYLRVQTSGSVSLPLYAWTHNAFIAHLTGYEPPFWIFYGFLMVMAVYNLFVYLSVRERAYLYYVLYIVTYLGFVSAIDGLSSQYIWPDMPWWNDKATTLFIGSAFGFGALFERDFLTTWQWSSWIDRGLKISAAVSFTLALASFVAPYGPLLRLLVSWGVVELVFIVITAILALTRGSRPAVFYFAAWMILFTGIMLNLLRALGIVGTSFVTDWALKAGAAIEVTLLSLGLADRINQMRYTLQRLNRQLGDNITELSSALEGAEAATRAKSEFIATVSHELRTPINAILNIPEGLLEEFERVSVVKCDSCKAIFRPDPGEEPNLAEPCPECNATAALVMSETCVYNGQPESTSRHLGYIHKASKHLLDVVSSILDFSKLEAGRMELALDDVDLSELLEDTLSPLRHLAQTKGLELVLEPVPAGGPLRGDRVRIAQIVVNLVGNAIKCSPDPGKVRVEAVDASDFYVIRVHDQGIGIAPADRARIFQSFSQVDSSNTRKFGGTGLGLAITKKFAEMHGGCIDVESEAGKGSTFIVRLPKAGPPHGPAHAPNNSAGRALPAHAPRAPGAGTRSAIVAPEVS